MFLTKPFSPQRPGESTQEGLQDVDDWDLTELNSEWDIGEIRDNVSSVGESGDDVPSPSPPLVCTSMFDLLLFLTAKNKHLLIQNLFPYFLSHQLPYRRNLVSRFSPTSSSDIAPSLDESIESGPLSDLQSEDDEGRKSADCCLELTAPPVNGLGGSSLVLQLVEDIQNQHTDPDVWKKIEVWTVWHLTQLFP